jgi:hypothetical protein
MAKGNRRDETFKVAEEIHRLLAGSRTGGELRQPSARHGTAGTETSTVNDKGSLNGSPLLLFFGSS